MVFYTIGLVLTAVGMAVPEALTWISHDEEKPIDTGLYHFWRWVMIIGLAVMYFELVGISLQSAAVFLGSIFSGFLVYRITFTRLRKQDELTPEWEWDITIPIIDVTIGIKYPSANLTIALGLMGIIMIMWGIL